MKNQIIKKIMAYLLVGAMVITTPMTASAAGLADAYDTGTGSDEDKSSNTDTNTDTNTNTGGIVPVPDGTVDPIVDEHNYDITGIVLDKESVNFEAVDQTDTLQARVLFGDYDPSKEEMVWATIDAKLKKEIENQIYWYSEDSDVVTIEGVKGDNSKAVIKATGTGEVKVAAWIEADRKVDQDNPYRPTEDDYQAWATIIVTEGTQTIDFEQDSKKFYQKHTYNLKEYTVINKGKSEIRANNAKAENLVYSGLNVTNGKATLSTDGILKVTKATASTKASFIIVGETSGKVQEIKDVEFGDAVPATRVEIKDKIKKLDFNLGTKTPNTSKEVSAVLYHKKGSKNITVGADEEQRDQITDIVTWKSKNEKIACVEKVEGKNDLTARIVAKDVGTTTITATATSGKKASIKVTVSATPTGVKILGIDKVEGEGSTWTGKRTTLTAVLTAGENNEIEIPAGKTKFQWKPSVKTLAKVSGKAVGTVKPTNYVGDTPKEVTITVKGKGIGYEVDGSYKLTIEQSDISDIGIAKRNYDGSYPQKRVVPLKVKKGTDKASIGKGSFNDYVVADIDAKKGDASSVGWSVSGSAATIDDNGKLEPVKPGKATVTASYVSIKNGKPQLNTKKITVTVVQNATSIAFAKEQTVKNPSPRSKEQTVTLKVKSIAPKKATCNIVDWKILAHINTGNAFKDVANQSVPTGSTSEFIKKATKNSVTIKIPGDAKAGSVIKVGAYTDGGVVAYAYVYVTEKTEKLTAEKTTISVELGKKEPLGNFTIDKNKTKNFNQKDLTFNETGTNGSTTAYTTEPVTYSVDKNSAKYIKVDQNGNVIGLQKTGNKKATVTVKTISGKSAKIKVTVN